MLTYGERAIWTGWRDAQKPVGGRAAFPAAPDWGGDENKKIERLVLVLQSGSSCSHGPKQFHKRILMCRDSAQVAQMRC